MDFPHLFVCLQESTSLLGILLDVFLIWLGFNSPLSPTIIPYRIQISSPYNIKQPRIPKWSQTCVFIIYTLLNHVLWEGIFLGGWNYTSGGLPLAGLFTRFVSSCLPGARQKLPCQYLLFCPKAQTPQPRLVHKHLKQNQEGQHIGEGKFAYPAPSKTGSQDSHWA